MSQEQARAIIARQMPDREKRRRADAVVQTGLSRYHARRRLRRLIARAPMTRSILFDTETTGLDPLLGDRVVEIAAIELMNDLPTGRQFHRFIDPERDMPEDATRVHGLTRADLIGKPRFAEIVDELCAFLGDCPLVAHNAPFDFGFLNAEFARLGLPPLAPERMIDTLVLAKTRFPGLPNSLDALCRRFAIDLSARTTHNALLDCRLLAEVYVELTGGRQRGLTLIEAQRRRRSPSPMPPPARAHRCRGRPSAAELAAHAAFLARIAEPVWRLPRSGPDQRDDELGAACRVSDGELQRQQAQSLDHRPAGPEAVHAPDMAVHVEIGARRLRLACRREGRAGQWQCDPSAAARVADRRWRDGRKSARSSAGAIRAPRRRACRRGGTARGHGRTCRAGWESPD